MESNQNISIKIIQIFLDNGFNINDVGTFGNVFGYICINSNIISIEILKFLISKGANINEVNRLRESAIHLFLQSKDSPNIEILKFFDENQFNFKVKDKAKIIFYIVIVILLKILKFHLTLINNLFFVHLNGLLRCKTKAIFL